MAAAGLDPVEEGRGSTGQGAGQQPVEVTRRKVPQRTDRRWTALPSQARVKRCGKSAPAPGATRAARQTPPGARSSVGRPARPMSPGRPHRWMATQPDPGNGPVDRTPPTGRLTVSTTGRGHRYGWAGEAGQPRAGRAGVLCEWLARCLRRPVGSAGRAAVQGLGSGVGLARLAVRAVAVLAAARMVKAARPAGPHRGPIVADRAPVREDRNTGGSEKPRLAPQTRRLHPRDRRRHQRAPAHNLHPAGGLATCPEDDRDTRVADSTLVKQASPETGWCRPADVPSGPV